MKVVECMSQYIQMLQTTITIRLLCQEINGKDLIFVLVSCNWFLTN